jgi:hypothetical protein
MPDNWTFVAAAYAVATLAFGGYWRWLNRRDRELVTLRRDRPGRSRQPSITGHPRPDAGSQASIQ